MRLVTFGVVVFVALSASACGSAGGVALPGLTAPAATTRLRVVDHRGPHVYPRVATSGAHTLLVDFACVGGGGAEVALAPTAGSWRFEEAVCDGRRSTWRLPAGPGRSTAVRVRINPAGRWSIVLAASAA